MARFHSHLYLERYTINVKWYYFTSTDNLDTCATTDNLDTCTTTENLDTCTTTDNLDTYNNCRNSKGAWIIRISTRTDTESLPVNDTSHEVLISSAGSGRTKYKKKDGT